MSFECDILVSNLVALTVGLLLLFLWYWRYMEEKHLEIVDLQEEIMEFRRRLRNRSTHRKTNNVEMFEFVDQLDDMKKHDVLADFEILPPASYVNEVISLETSGGSN